MEETRLRELPQRKSVRLANYDYSQSGAYFITICTQDRLNVFGDIVRDVAEQALFSCRLNPKGNIVENEWYRLNNRFPNISLEKFVVMPNHVHGIIVIGCETRQEQSPCPTVRNSTIGDILCAYKSVTTKSCNKMDAATGRKIWQYKYHDHIIRNNDEYMRICQYIDDNPAKWKEDIYFM